MQKKQLKETFFGKSVINGRREKNAGSKWTEDRKKRDSEKMKEYRCV